jgi:hypothetical protein
MTTLDHETKEEVRELTPEETQIAAGGIIVVCFHNPLGPLPLNPQPLPPG